MHLYASFIKMILCYLGWANLIPMKRILLLALVGLFSHTVIAQDPPENDLCDTPVDIDALFHGDMDVTYTSDIYTNVGATTDDNDPDFGLDCWLEIIETNGDTDPRDQTIWFTFVGDGLEYNIRTSDCGGAAKNYITEGDAQLAIFTGDCGDWDEVVACNEDSEDIDWTDENIDDWYAEVDFLTEDGQLYYLLIDGLNWDIFKPGFGAAEGEFCFEVTHGTPSGIPEQDLQVSFYPNPASDMLTVQCKHAIDGLSIFDVNGRLVLQDQPRVTQLQLDISDLHSGVFQVVIAGNGQVNTQRLIIN